MNRITKVGLLSLIAIVQALTLVGGFLAYEQMSGAMTRLKWDYKVMYEETKDGLIIDFGLDPNPFAPLIPLVLLGLFLAVVLLVDQVRHKNAENRDAREIAAKKIVRLGARAKLSMKALPSLLL